jgi:hypothetical protein
VKFVSCFVHALWRADWLTDFVTSVVGFFFAETIVVSFSAFGKMCLVSLAVRFSVSRSF